jgi:hypothetical protein
MRQIERTLNKEKILMAQATQETPLGRIEIVDQPEETTKTASKKRNVLPLALALISVLTAVALLLRRSSKH